MSPEFPFRITPGVLGHILLIAIFAAATASGLAAAVRWGMKDWRGVGPLALAAGACVGSLVTFRGLPPFPPASASPWVVWLVVFGGVGMAALAWPLRRVPGLAAGLVGLAWGVAVVVLPLRVGIRGVEGAGARPMWTVGVPLGLALLGFLAATSEGRERGGRAWSAALGVCFLCGVPGVVFASSALLGELMLAIACAWAGLVGLAMLRPGVQLGPAAALATLGYATVWILSLFYAAAPPLAVGLGVAGPAVVAGVGWAWPRTGLMPGGRARAAALVAIAVVLAGGAAAVSAWGYFGGPD